VSESELLYDWRFTANQFILAPCPFETHDQYFFQLNSCGYSPYVTTSLTRGCVCRLQLLLALASAVKSRGINDHILLSQIRDFHNLEGQVPVFISPRNRVAQLYPQALASLFVASYDSQGYGGGIRLRLTRTTSLLCFFTDPLLINGFFYCYVTSPRTCLPNRSIATAVRVTYRDTSCIVACGHYLATAVLCLHSSCFEQIRHNTLISLTEYCMKAATLLCYL
jgi:hypothetical protein